MAVSGTVPFFSYGTTPPDTGSGAVVVTAISGGQLVGSNTISNEPLNLAFRRLTGVLGQVSGGTTASGVNITLPMASGVRAVQQELVMRAADLEAHGPGNRERLGLANAILTASGEVRGF